MTLHPGLSLIPISNLILQVKVSVRVALSAAGLNLQTKKMCIRVEVQQHVPADVVSQHNGKHALPAICTLDTPRGHIHVCACEYGSELTSRSHPRTPLSHTNRRVATDQQ